MSLGLLDARQACKRSASSIIINVIEARGLVPTSKAGTTDSHLVLALYAPDCIHKHKVIDQKRGHCQSTSVKEKTLNPVWNETKRFEVEDLIIQLEGLYLIAELWDHDKHFLGWFEVPLKDLADTKMHDNWYTLGKRKSKDKVNGEVHLQITIVPQMPLARIEIHDELLTMMPTFFFDAHWNRYCLKELSLINCKLESIHPKIAKLKALEFINLSENNIRVLPEEFFQLENLIDVDLSTNQITVIPPNITLLKNLKRINLKNNPLKAEGIAPLNNLRDCEVLK